MDPITTTFITQITIAIQSILTICFFSVSLDAQFLQVGGSSWLVVYMRPSGKCLSRGSGLGVCGCVLGGGYVELSY